MLVLFPPLYHRSLDVTRYLLQNGMAVEARTLVLSPAPRTRRADVPVSEGSREWLMEHTQERWVIGYSPTQECHLQATVYG